MARRQPKGKATKAIHAPAKGSKTTKAKKPTASKSKPAPVARAVDDRSRDLREIKDLSRFMYCGYAATASRLKTEEKMLRIMRDNHFPKNYEANALHAVVSSSKVCDEWCRDLERLCELVRLRLPELWSRLRIIGKMSHWERERGFDWNAVEAELRTIEAAVDGANQDIPGDKLSRPDSPGNYAKMFGFSRDTFLRKVEEGKIRAKKLSTKSYQVHIDDLPAKSVRPRTPITEALPQVGTSGQK